MQYPDVLTAQVEVFGQHRAQLVDFTGLAQRQRHFNDAGVLAAMERFGGIGDKVSLMLAPIVAACGGFVPMISGRGLGHTGGTLDKLSAISGYETQPDIATFRKVVREVGCAVIGQTDDLAPADRRLYAIRDVTGQEPELSTSGGTSDARFIKDYCPVAEFGLVGQTMHKAEERVALADLESLTEIYHRVLKTLLGTPC